MNNSSNKIVFLLLIFSACVRADATTLEIRDIHPKQIIRKDIILESDAEIEIETVIGKILDKKEFISAAWILENESRELIWHCPLKCDKKKSNKKGDLHYSQTLNLRRGMYEVYYSVNPNPYKKIKGIGDVITNLSGGVPRSPLWGIKIEIPEGNQVVNSPLGDDSMLVNKPLLSILRTKDNEYIQKKFSSKSSTKVRIYAIGEGSEREREMYDYAWITDVHTRNRVWEMSIRNTEYGGGAEKNRIVDEIIELNPGNYSVYYATDGSHSFESWNKMPPYDPSHWGITIWAVDATDEALSVVSTSGTEQLTPVIELNYVRNNSVEFEGFTLQEAANLQIRCLGEYTESTREFVDYGFILNARTRKIIWKMNYGNTEHAGGGKKNRIFDEYVHLPAGAYLVYYISDDSHAYNSWNDRAPHDPGSWGISIFANSDGNEVESYEEREDAAILAQHARIRNNEHLKKKFSLESSEKIRIYAIGEGDRDGMYDYGWLTDDQNNIVWKMQYEETTLAGGAKKNRLYNGVMRLQAGSYILHYRTDGSHAYRQWNSEPPVDLIHWGVMVIRQNAE